MNKTTPPGRAKLSRSSTETTDPIADELRRYDYHLRDVRGLAARARGQAPALSGARFADRLPQEALIMWSSKSAHAAPNGQLPHDTGRGYT